MSSVSAHGGLVHVIMRVRTLAVKSVTFLVRHSRKLLMLHSQILRLVMDMVDVENFNVTLRKILWNRRLFIAGHYMLMLADYWYDDSREVLWEQDTDLFPTFVLNTL